MVTFSGVVDSRPHFFVGTHTHALHETFKVRSDAGTRVEVVDNVTLAPRVPVAPGDRVDVCGELVHDRHGHPIVHYTHHDPRGVHPDGYIDFDGKRYA